MPASDSSSPASPGSLPGAAGGAAPPFWEWVVAALGLVLVLASIGYLVHDAVTLPATPPTPQVEVLATEPQEGGRFLVQVRVHNRGTQAAAALRLTGELKRAGQVVEQADTEFQYVPGHSARDGGLFFARDPRTFQLDLQVRSYQQP
jgi:uncharacterized protein (TIGR02588 family)